MATRPPPPRIVSLGSDCSVAMWKKNTGRREETGPVDWALSFADLGDVLLSPSAPLLRITGDRGASSVHGLSFPHVVSEGDTEDAVARRRERLHAWLRESAAPSGREVVFVRKGHGQQLHGHEMFVLRDERADAAAFAGALAHHFPAARARVHVLIACDVCEGWVDRTRDEPHVEAPPPPLNGDTDGAAAAAAAAPRLTVYNVTGCATTNELRRADGSVEWRAYQDVVARHCESLIHCGGPPC